MKTERDIAPLRVVQRVKDLDPGIEQGRQDQHHHPMVNRDAVKAVAMVVVPTILVCLVVWGVRTWAKSL